MAVTVDGGDEEQNSRSVSRVSPQVFADGSGMECRRKTQVSGARLRSEQWQSLECPWKQQAGQAGWQGPGLEGEV